MTESKYCLWIVARGDGTHYPAHDAFALHLQKAFAALGYDTPIARRLSEIRGRALVIAPHRILEHSRFLAPNNAILINTEHFVDPPPLWQCRYANILAQFEVWDFSPRNIGILNKMGVRNAKFLELGVACNAPSEGTIDKDIAILFYGAMSARRREIVAELARKDVQVTCAPMSFGETLRALIARAVIVLNIHRVHPCSFEMLRMLDLLPYGQFVVSEKGSDPWLETRFENGVVFGSRAELASVCISYLADPEACRRLGLAGRTAFESVDQCGVLKRLLALG